MPHFMNQHDPKPGVQTIRLADDQFERLVELLAPGYTLAKTYLEQMAAARAARAEPPTEPEAPTDT